MLDALWRFDHDFDLTILHAIVSAFCALLVLWMMVCRTPDAGFADARALRQLVQRVAMAALAISLAASAATPIYNDAAPWVSDVVVRTCFLVVLVIFSIRLRFDQPSS